MARVRERVDAEFENIERVIAEMPDSGRLANLSSLELAGLATLLHNFYNGLENIIKQVLIASGRELPQGASWHQYLLAQAASCDIISASTVEELRKYLAFRHFFSHCYSFDLDKDRLIPLIEGIHRTITSFRRDVDRAIDERL